MGGGGQTGQGMEQARLLVCLEECCSEPNSSSTRGKGTCLCSGLAVGLTSPSLPTSRAFQAAWAPWVLAGLLEMVAKSSSLKTSILP